MGHLDLIIIICLFILCVINYIYFYIQNTEIRLYKYIKTGDIFIENDITLRKVKIVDYYIDDTGRILIDFVYIDENNNPISEVHTKSLYNFDIHFRKKLN